MIKKDLWDKNGFFEEKIPLWSCPHCDGGHLVLIQDSLKSEESALSREWRDDECWEPDWLQGVFSCMFRCSNPSCKEVIVCSGWFTLSQCINDTPYGFAEDYKPFYTPQYFTPSIPVFRIPANCPEEISNVIKSAFSLVWASLPSTVNMIRVSLEMIMDDHEIPKTNPKGGWIPLDNRIKYFTDANPKLLHLKDLLDAAKWLGNAGSHGENLTISDALDAFELLEHVISEIYDTQKEHLKEVAEQIKLGRGPRSKATL